MQIIYHGSYCEVKNPQLKSGKYSKDFGQNLLLKYLHISIKKVKNLIE